MTSRRSGRQDHYDILGVADDAPEEVIRAAYRAMAAKHHPDRNPDHAAAELMLKRINAAYEVLGDPVKRRLYDELTRPVNDTEEPPHPTSHRPPDNGEPNAAATAASPNAPPAPKQKGPLRTLLKVVGVLVAIGAFGIACLVAFVAYNEGQERDEQNSVALSAEYRPTECRTPESPVLVTIKNGAKRTIKSVSFYLQAFVAGRSDDLAAPRGARESTAIVGPGDTLQTCWALPNVGDYAGTFTVRAEKMYVSFYGDGEFITRGQ
jgi:curved DNA-binding protein CbpA